VPTPTLYVRRTTGDPERAKAAARAFRGDCLLVYRGERATPETLVWKTFWTDALAARRFAELLHQQQEPQAATHCIDTTGPTTTLIAGKTRAASFVGAALR
jgi:hypothetical protein